MAFIMGDSFDLSTGAGLLTSGIWSSGTSPAVSTTTRFNFGQSFYTNNGNSIIRDGLPPSSNTVFFAFAYLMTGGNYSSYIAGRDASNYQFTIMFNYDGSIVVKTGDISGTTVATFAGAYTPTVWTHFQIEVVVHNTAGEVHIRKNGNTVDDFAATGINTRGGTSNNYVTGVRISSQTAQSPISYFDDFLMFDNSGSTLNTWCGDVRCYVLYPNGAGGSTQFTPLSGNNWSNVEDVGPNDGDTTYVYSSTVGAEDLYTLQDLSGITTGVTLAQLRVTARKQDAGARSAQSVLVSGANTDLGTSTVLSSSYTQLIKAYPVNPSGANWAASDINALQVGVTVSA